MKVLYAIDFDETRTPCLEYYYELPESLDVKIELKGGRGRTAEEHQVPMVHQYR